MDEFGFPGWLFAEYAVEGYPHEFFPQYDRAFLRSISDSKKQRVILFRHCPW